MYLRLRTSLMVQNHQEQRHQGQMAHTALGHPEEAPVMFTVVSRSNWINILELSVSEKLLLEGPGSIVGRQVDYYFKTPPPTLGETPESA